MPSLWSFCLRFPWGRFWVLRYLCVNYKKMTQWPWPLALGSPKLGLTAGRGRVASRLPSWVSLGTETATLLPRTPVLCSFLQKKQPLESGCCRKTRCLSISKANLTFPWTNYVAGSLGTPVIVLSSILAWI